MAKFLRTILTAIYSSWETVANAARWCVQGGIYCILRATLLEISFAEYRDLNILLYAEQKRREADFPREIDLVALELLEKDVLERRKIIDERMRLILTLTTAVLAFLSYVGSRSAIQVLLLTGPLLCSLFVALHYLDLRAWMRLSLEKMTTHERLRARALCLLWNDRIIDYLADVYRCQKRCFSVALVILVVSLVARTVPSDSASRRSENIPSEGLVSEVRLVGSLKPDGDCKFTTATLGSGWLRVTLK